MIQLIKISIDCYICYLYTRCIAIDASLTLIESFILGVLTFVDYRRLRPHHQRQQKQPEEELTTSAIEQQQQRQELAIDLNLK